MKAKKLFDKKKEKQPTPVATAKPREEAVALLIDEKPKTKWQLLWQEYRYLGFAFAIPVILMFLLYVALELYPFGDGSVLVLDLNAQYVFFYEALREWVWGDASLLYSFGRSLGGEFMGIYAYYIASPFSYIVALFPRNCMLEALLTIFLLKAGCCGATFGFYLHKTAPKKNKLAIVTVSVMYAMCAYCVVQQHNSMWIDAVMWLPLLTYGIEELIKKGHFRLYVVSLAVTMMSNFYIGYMVCLYTLFYFFFYYFKTNTNHENNPYREKKHFFKSFLRIGIYTIIALGAAAVIWLSAYYALSFGKNEFTNPSWTFKAKFTLMEFLTKLLPGSFDTVRPEGLPFVYCGLPMLFLVPVYFLAKKISIREKIFSVGLIGFFVASFCLGPLDLIWHGFQNPNWLNYRYSFMLCFALLLMTYHALCELDTIKSRWFFTIGCGIGLFAIIAEKFNFPSYFKANGKLDTFQFVWFTLIATAVYAVVLYLICANREKKAKSRSLSLILLFVICIEMTINGISNAYALDRDVVYSTHPSYNNFLSDIRPVTDEIQKTDTSFYRSEKTSFQRVNENMGLNIRGVSNSTSTLNASTIEFLDQMGYAAGSHWSKYMCGTPLNDSLLGIKYIYDKNEQIYETELYYNHQMMEEHYELALEGDVYSAFRNPYALSLAYVVDDAINSIHLEDYANPYERLNAMITAMVGETEEIQIFRPITDVEISHNNCKTSSIAKHTKYEPEVTSRDAQIHFIYTAEEDCNLYFYLPTDYPREASMKVNSIDFGYVAKDNYTYGETVRNRMIGNYKAGDKVLISLTLNKENLYVRRNVPVIYQFDWDLFEATIARLAQSQLIIDEEYSETYLPGTLTTQENGQTVLATIPYDKGWIVTVDGVEVETYETMDALTAFDVESAGTHEIVLQYRPKIFAYGMIITVACSIIFLGLCALIWLMNKKGKHFFLLTGVPVREFDPDDEAPKKLSPEDLADLEAERALKESETPTTSGDESSPD